MARVDEAIGWLTRNVIGMGTSFLLGVLLGMWVGL